ncbi:DUF1996 domain-containing protein [Streptosporangium sp. NPDC048865]|uniref:DUF1996 domain-containing protein n=1 Tax=Streptosporangium sp. NPDC048865 TaxID=3155766 RepID=UPI0034142CAD
MVDQKRRRARTDAGPPGASAFRDIARRGRRLGRIAATAFLAAGLIVALSPLIPPSDGGPAAGTTRLAAAASLAHLTTGERAGALPAASPSSTFSGPPPRAQYREFAANCTASHYLSDDPIVYPGLVGAAHNHTFFGNKGTDAKSTNASLVSGVTSCQDPKDGSAYWSPTLLQDGKPVKPEMATIYYKSGVSDYRTVKPFPVGFRLVVGDAKMTSEASFKGYWSCGNARSKDFPGSCPSGSSLIMRHQAPSCWDGVDLDSADHRSHVAYPVGGVCPASHPVAVPMLEMKVPYKLPGGRTDGLSFSSGVSFSFHYDFMNGWDQQRQVALVKHCINGGRQCNGVGYDQHKP